MKIFAAIRKIREEKMHWNDSMKLHLKSKYRTEDNRKEKRMNNSSDPTNLYPKTKKIFTTYFLVVSHWSIFP